MLSVTAVAGGRISMELESLKEIGWSRYGNWIGIGLQVYADEDECFLRINRVKIKTVFLKSNIIFKVF
jgi:hypothetical protein